LNIVPVSISYEWESCDILKALELYQSQYARYIKKPGEDLNSILTGILQPKGKVHIELCEPISVAELTAFENMTNNEYHKAVAQLIDRRINTAYRLYPNNYIAHDLLYGNTKYRSMYTDEQYQTFTSYLAKLDKYDETCDLERLKEIFVGIYSNPVDQKKR
jgi:1-acyl-sn-glycerol-3-phosphate acyltransferase